MVNDLLHHLAPSEHLFVLPTQTEVTSTSPVPVRKQSFLIPPPYFTSYIAHQFRGQQNLLKGQIRTERERDCFLTSDTKEEPLVPSRACSAFSLSCGGQHHNFPQTAAQLEHAPHSFLLATCNTLQHCEARLSHMQVQTRSTDLILPMATPNYRGKGTSA